MKTRRTTQLTLCFFSALLAGGLLFWATSARAQCIAGIPCYTSATLNDPADPADGPNVTGSPNANKTDDAACDADFMNQIYARAFLESTREIINNETVIRKPDSVLEMSCYDQLVKIVGKEAAPLFSENSDSSGDTMSNYFGGSITINEYNPGRLTNAMQSLILNSLNTYITSNFGHAYLGGAASVGAAGGGGTFNCDYMNSVYFAAKCNNTGGDDKFLSFQTLATVDPRTLPAVCASAVTGITTDIIDVAENKDFRFVNFDKVQNYLGLLDPADCNTVKPLLTGLMVTVPKDSGGGFFNLSGSYVGTKESFEEKICPNPSCYYDRVTDKCVK